MLKAPFSAATWRDTAYLLCGLPLGVASFTFVVTGLSLAAGLLVTFVGIPVLAAALLAIRWFGALERRRASWTLGEEVAEPPRRVARDRGIGHRMLAVIRDGASWREVLWGLVLLPVGIAGFTAAITLWAVALGWATNALWWWALPEEGDDAVLGPIDGDGIGWIVVRTVVGVALVLVVPHVVRWLAVATAATARVLLGPTRGELERRVEDLATTRAGALDAAATELRRIERDLHDGAQARLVGLALDLGMAREELERDPVAARQMLDRAHAGAKEALQELRDLARGIHPAILTDRGLDAALSALAARTPLAVDVQVALDERPPPEAETAAYFVAAEALANAAKHAEAQRVTVRARRAGDALDVWVVDDGRGGADPAVGSGLRGLRGRIEALDGTLEVASPHGAGTTVRAQVPWR